MQILVFRHAERDQNALSFVASAESDPGLNSKGQRQAQGLLQSCVDQKLPAPTKIFCSPKLRARQTLMPLAKHFSLELTSLPNLDERRHHENGDNFSQRVKAQINEFSKLSGTQSLYFATHLDWLEEALIHIPSDTDLLQNEFTAWGTCQYIHFEIEAGLWKLRGRGRFE